jgi:hypothetical protein
MQNSAVKVGYFFYYPRNLGGSNPLICVFELGLASNVDSINYLLYLGDCWHYLQFAVILKV